MVGHIYIQKSEEDFKVRMADPRSAIPRLDETPDGLTRTPNSLGCSAVDLAHLEVSLYRRQLELQHLNPKITLPALSSVRATVQDWIHQGRFSQMFYELSLATYFSAYAGCRCKYCLASDRRWLYDQMSDRARHYVTRCAEYAEGKEFALCA
jgi:hypothetical protein